MFSLSTTRLNVRRQPPLDITFYSYPWGQCAAISRVFSEAEIPHILWGDQVLTFHGANQVILVKLSFIYLHRLKLIMEKDGRHTHSR